MKIVHIKASSDIYSSNVYFVLGEWKRIEDVNTLIDAGNDPQIVRKLEGIDSGVGKKKVDQLIITHNHSDHSGMLPLIKKAYNPKIYAFSPHIEGADCILEDGQRIRIGDSEFEVVHAPGHSNDSICLVNEAAGVIFTGDTQLSIAGCDNGYEEQFYRALKHLSMKKISEMYPGHGDPLKRDIAALICESLRNISAERALSKQIGILKAG